MNNEPRSGSDVLFVGGSEAFGGAEHFVVLVARELAARGWRTRVLSMEPDTYEKWLAGTGVSCTQIGPVRGVRGWLRVLREHPTRNLFIQQINIDCFRSDVFVAARLAGIPRIILRMCTELEPWPRADRRLHLGVIPGLGLWRWMFLGRELTKALVANRVIVLNRQEIRRACSRFRFPRDKIHVIPNGVDTATYSCRPEARVELRRQWGLGEEDYVVVLSGRLSAEKGLDWCFDAVMPWLQARAQRHCVLVGDGAMRDHLEARTRNAGLARQVRFLGFRADVPDVLSACDVLVQSSHREAMGRAIIEGLSVGLPAIATDRAGPRDILGRPDAPGFLVRFGDSAALVDRLSAYESDPKLRADHSRRARTLAETEYGLTGMMDRLCALFLKGPRSR